MGCSSRGRKESDTIERLHFTSLSGTARSPKVILHFPRPSPEITSFSKGPWFLLVGNRI